MLCDKCGVNQATVSYRQNINGVETRMYLCDSCAKGYDFTNLFQKQMNGFSDFVQALFAADNPLGQDAGHNNEKACPICHKTFSQICDDGLMGCSECYHVFAQQLEPTLEKLHGTKPMHMGRIPARIHKNMDDDKRLEQLEKDLRQAVERQEYEDAAKLRDQIAVLKAKSASKNEEQAGSPEQSNNQTTDQPDEHEKRKG